MERFIFIFLALILSVIGFCLCDRLFAGLHPWIVANHSACMSGGKALKLRHKGWRTRCESNHNWTANHSIDALHHPIYTVSCVNNAISKKRGHIWFGPELKNGHPSSINYETKLEELDAMSVAYSTGEFIVIEATDFGIVYYIQIKTPDPHSASCYKLVNNKSPNITLTRDTKC